MTSLLSRLSLRTGGESHGAGVTVLLEGLPRGLPLDVAAIDAELVRRQGGAGRSGRQKLEQDRVRVLGGVRKGVLLGSPLVLFVENRDHSIETLPDPVRPRPGHVDLAGCYRYLDHDIRGSLERASARETAGRVAGGAVCQQLLRRLAVEVFGFVRRIGPVALDAGAPGEIGRDQLAALRAQRDQSHLGTLDQGRDAVMLEEIRRAGKAGDTLGGVVEVQSLGMLPGAGSHLQWNERLDARLAAALMSIQAIKGVEIGLGFAAASEPGSAVHDPILPPVEGGLPGRPSNRAGGIEGGIANGQNVVVRAAMKPLSTLREPLASIDLSTGAADSAGYERSDVCAVASAAVVAEAMVALVLADALLARLGGETLAELEQRAAATWGAVRSLVPGTRGS